VLDACVALLDEVGRSRLSREQIARRAGVSLPAVNRRYASVDEILLAIASTPIHPPPDGVADVDLRTHLVDRLTRSVETLLTRRIRRSAAELVAAATGDDEINSAFIASLTQVRQQSHPYLERAVSTGEVAAGTSLDDVLDLIDGAFYYRLLWRDEPLTSDEVGPLVDRVLAGFRPTPRN